MEYEMSNEEVIATVSAQIFADAKDTAGEVSILEARQIASDAAANTYQDVFTQAEWADAIYAILGYI